MANPVGGKTTIKSGNVGFKCGVLGMMLHMKLSLLYWVREEVGAATIEHAVFANILLVVHQITWPSGFHLLEF